MRVVSKWLITKALWITWCGAVFNSTNTQRIFILDSLITMANYLAAAEATNA